MSISTGRVNGSLIDLGNMKGVGRMSKGTELVLSVREEKVAMKKAMHLMITRRRFQVSEPLR